MGEKGTLLGTMTYPIPFGTFEDDDYPLAKVGYVSSLEGNKTKLVTFYSILHVSSLEPTKGSHDIMLFRRPITVDRSIF